jgi:hypothetical protein
MKRIVLIAALVVCLVIIFHLFILTSRKTPIFAGYDVLFTKSLGAGQVLYGLAAKEGAKTDPLSLIAVYREKDLIYRFSPAVPTAVGYPRPLMLEKAELISEGGNPFIITSWGETGADYFGTHPILIRCDGKKFGSVKFYKGYLSDSPRIRHIPWTRKDFQVKNHYDPSDAVYTILTQGVSAVEENMIELRFYADDKPHAAEHDYVTFKFPVK